MWSQAYPVPEDPVGLMPGVIVNIGTAVTLVRGRRPALYGEPRAWFVFCFSWSRSSLRYACASVVWLIRLLCVRCGVRFPELGLW